MSVGTGTEAVNGQPEARPQDKRLQVDSRDEEAGMPPDSRPASQQGASEHSSAELPAENGATPMDEDGSAAGARAGESASNGPASDALLADEDLRSEADERTPGGLNLCHCLAISLPVSHQCFVLHVLCLLS